MNCSWGQKVKYWSCQLAVIGLTEVYHTVSWMILNNVISVHFEQWRKNWAWYQRSVPSTGLSTRLPGTTEALKVKSFVIVREINSAGFIIPGKLFLNPILQFHLAQVIFSVSCVTIYLPFESTLLQCIFI